MEPILHAATLVSPAAVSALFSAIWEGSVLAACVALCLRMVPRLTAASRSLVWLTVFCFLVLLHIVPSFSARIGSANPAHAIHLDLSWSVVVLSIWAVLSLWRGTQLILSAVRLSKLASRATPLALDPAILPIIESDRTAALCTSTEVERPSVFGFFRPRILIPPALIEKLTASELQQVVLHEMEHLRRRDDWTNLLQKVALVLFPLNPVLLWVERRLCAERELACDDCVLRSSTPPKAYAICLTRLAEFSMIQRSLSLTLGAWERQSELVRRVHRLLRRPAESMGVRKAQFVTTGLILGALAGVIALSRTPQLISFAPAAQPALQARVVPQASQPVSLREVTLPILRDSATTQAPIHMVKAVMPERTIQSAYRAKPVRRNAPVEERGPSQLLAESPQDFADSPQRLVVLTEWTDADSPPRVVFAVLPVQRPDHQANHESRFAAVQTPDGWLIVQI